MNDLEVVGPTIRLGQLLKLSGLVGSGGEVRSVLAGDQVTVNGEPESRRGRQLRDGDVVSIDSAQVRVVMTEADPPDHSSLS